MCECDSVVRHEFERLLSDDVAWRNRCARRFGRLQLGWLDDASLAPQTRQGHAELHTFTRPREAIEERYATVQTCFASHLRMLTMCEKGSTRRIHELPKLLFIVTRYPLYSARAPSC